MADKPRARNKKPRGRAGSIAMSREDRRCRYTEVEGKKKEKKIRRVAAGNAIAGDKRAVVGAYT